MIEAKLNSLVSDDSHHLASSQGLVWDNLWDGLRFVSTRVYNSGPQPVDVGRGRVNLESCFRL
ncbi:MAG: hypothetical protein JWL62_1696, partial [Hyphomicrobiales bacterium]|nr:hypothetical protein [Hyphomicrobiales bacterium]